MFLQESHPSLQAPVIGLFQSIAERANFLGSSINAVEYINSPYRSFGELCLRIVVAASEPGNTSDTNLQLLARHCRSFIVLSENDELTPVARRACLKILSNVLLNDDCRYEILSNKGLELFVSRLDAFDDVEGQRIAAKALLNISISSRRFFLMQVRISCE